MGAIEHRQFGRRASHIAARAVFSHHVQLPCVIENLSDGGALLAFEEQPPKIASLRLVVEDTSFNLLCEARHAAGSRLGVKFARLGEGIALNRHFQRQSVEPQDLERPQRLDPRRAAATAVSVRELRDKLLAPVDDPQEDADGEPREMTPAEMLAAGCLPPGISLEPVHGAQKSRRPARIVRVAREVKTD